MNQNAMARPRGQSTADLPKEPHLVSLKVLRLSRPSLAQQYPLPRDAPDISPLASLAYPADSSDKEFMLNSNLSLPRGFGSAHVGEAFSCTLCANNEVFPTNTNRRVSSIRIVAEMQTPTQSVPLELQSASADEDSPDAPSEPGASIQKILTFDLKEEGSHVLAVNVSYVETIAQASGMIPISRPRSFRKLYQFVAQPCLSVRTKATELPSLTNAISSVPLLRFALEAQLENVGDAAIVLEAAKLLPNPPFKTTSLNWDSELALSENPKLAPRDVIQVAFLVEQQLGSNNGSDELKSSLKRDGRAMLGQLAIEWRGSMGDRGFLSTGNLMSRRKP